MSQALLDRITELESQVYGIRLELIELRAQAEAAAPPRTEPASGFEPQSPAAPDAPPFWPPPRPPRTAAPPPRPRRDLGAELRTRAERLDRQLSAGDLLGAK